LESEDIALEGKVLVLGFGGAGRMFAVEAGLKGADVTVAVRSPGKVPARIPELRDETRLSVCGLERITGTFDLLVNSTPVGMFPETDGCPVSEEILRNCGAVFDAVYNPAETKLLRAARKLGLPSAGGLPMLVWQAAEAHKIWRSAVFDDGDIAALVLETQEILN
jgi:shikimate dehydrogenase